MRLRHSLMVLSISAALSMSTSAWAQSNVPRSRRDSLAAAENQPDVAQVSSCVIQIDSDADAQNRSESGNAVAMINSTMFQDSVVQKVLNITPEQRRKLVSISCSGTDESRLQIEVTLLKGDVTYGAKASDDLLIGMRDALQATLQRSADVQRKIVEQRTAIAEKEVAAARERLADMRSRVREYRSATANVITEPGDVSEVMINLRNQKRSLESELRSQRAQLREIERAAPRERLGDEAANLRENIADQEDRLKTINEQLTKLEDPNFVKMAEQIPTLMEEEQQVQVEISQLSNNLIQRRGQQQMPTKYVVTILGGSAEK